MAFALLFNGSGYVSIPAKTAGSTSADTWTAIFDLEIPNTTDQTIYAATDTATTDYFRITGSNTVSWRIGPGTIQNVTLSASFPINTRFILGIYRESGRNLVITIDAVEAYRANGVAFGTGGNAISITSIGKASAGVFSGKMYEATIQGANYLNPDQADTTAWGDGALTGIPSTNWEFYSAGTTPIEFTGTIPTLSYAVDEVVSEDSSTYFSGTETPFTFANTGTALTGSGLSLSSAGLLSGTYTGTPITGVIVTGTDAATDTAASNAFNIETMAVPQVPQGIVTIGAITVGETTATVPYTYSLADQTGFEYRLNSGAAVADASSPVDLTGLTADTAYTIEVRAVNATGAGAWSTSANFTTDPVVVTAVTITLPPMYRNTNTAPVGAVNFSFVNVIRDSDGVEIASIAGLSTDASGVLSFTDIATGAAIISETVYLIAHRETTGQFGLTKVTAV